MTCTYVTERAIVGPCEVCGHEGHAGGKDGCDGEGAPCDVSDVLCCECDQENRYAMMMHAYLGPVLARCGHEEKWHRQGTCYVCLAEAVRFERISRHAFTDVN